MRLIKYDPPLEPFEEPCPDCKGDTEQPSWCLCDTCKGTGVVLTEEGVKMLQFLQHHRKWLWAN
jgi:DnaJ-class molecular chaperone